MFPPVFSIASSFFKMYDDDDDDDDGLGLTDQNQTRNLYKIWFQFLFSFCFVYEAQKFENGEIAIGLVAFSSIVWLSGPSSSSVEALNVKLPGINYDLRQDPDWDPPNQKKDLTLAWSLGWQRGKRDGRRTETIGKTRGDRAH